MSKPKKIGIYAGSFDPVHHGHVDFALLALELGMDRVYLLPEPRPRRKQGVKSLGHRVAMAELATNKYARLGVIRLNQHKFTPISTLPILKARFPNHDLSLLFGDDVIAHMLDHIGDWPRLDTLASCVEIVVMPRLRSEQSEIDQLFTILSQTTGLKFNYRILKAGVGHVSSSGVRREIATAGKSNHVPEEVVEYIIKHKLYASQEG
ncbi:adenylyltransferase/cytidyltransferase family protein [Candidatus Saccharibacteria bacterium]|nr:adenylyltransferase/cytidyltransferase family protein [Candidatus Saccharibacteria bacterium]